MSARGIPQRPKRYPDSLRKRAYELWRAKGRSLYKAWRRLPAETPYHPSVTTLKRWMEADEWEANADAFEARMDQFTAFKQYMWSHYEHAAHLALIDDKLMDVARYIESGGKAGIRRLMVFIPPRHGKSMTVARLFPAWFLGRNPDCRIILTGYGLSLVNRHSRFTRNLIRSPRYREVFPTVRIARDDPDRGSWNIAQHEGGLDAVGIRGAVTGKGAHLLIIDDPVKNRQQVETLDQRESLWEAYQHDLYTRLEPNGAIVLIMTRWHPDDLAGRLLQREPDAWTVIRLPAIAEDNESAAKAESPNAETESSKGAEKGDGDELGRQGGEALWAARYPVEELMLTRAAIGALAWSALYQQRPTLRQGGLFKPEWIERARAVSLPTLRRIVVAVDPAASGGAESGSTGSAETGIIVAAIDEQDPPHAYVLADISLRGTPDAWGRAVLAAVDQWEADAVVLEVNQGGDMATHTLRTINRNVRIRSVRATRGKALRAEPAAALYEQGRVHHFGVFAALEEQLTGWTAGAESPDRLDALVWALTDLVLEKRGVGLR